MRSLTIYAYDVILIKYVFTYINNSNTLFFDISFNEFQPNKINTTRIHVQPTLIARLGGNVYNY